MITFTHRATAVVAASLFTLGMQAQKQPKTTQPVQFGKQKELIRCGTVEYNANQNKDKFEQWLAPKVAALKNSSQQKSGLSTNEVVTIPVVVHIIHNGDAIGEDENIPDGQVLSQITVLNQDFRKMFNTPGYNTNAVGADMEIEFCLAQRDPNGIATTGIIRHNLAGSGSWEFEEVEVMKTQTQWNPEKYLNIWVVNNISAGFGGILAGYAQFPVNSGVGGLDDIGEETAANRDGVVIAYEYFGSEDLYPQGNYAPGTTGRSATHEVGHFFGLRHIWGDEDNCTADDYCNDTPIHYSANQGCPGPNFNSCPTKPGNDMTANYMDYTDDSCKSIFTADQKFRMQAVLANSPRRHSLITSDGCVPGLIYDNDGSLNIEGFNTDCGSVFAPEVILKNTGNNTITSATFTYHIDNQPNSTYTWTGSLAFGQQTAISIEGLTPGQGAHTFTTAIQTINGVADQVPGNDALTSGFTITSLYNTSEVITLTINTDQYGDETIWILADSDENPIAANIDFETGDIEYYEGNETYVIEIPVDSDQCYMFAILDLAGDGMCCQYGNGSYTIATSGGTVIATGGAFASQEIVEFGINDAQLGIEGLSRAASITLYPNPANSQITLSIAETAILPDAYTVYNNLGQVMGSGKITGSNQPINISSYATGVYFVKVQGSTGTQTLQFIKY